MTVTPTEITSPTITVLMSCYNSAKWLDEAITSVLIQTYRDFEFIIVDDGSVDNTLEIIKRFAALDSRIVVVTKPNSGLSDSLNVGIKMARGEWIARLDADDRCEPTRLQQQIELALTNLNLVFIGSGLTIIDEVGSKLNTYCYPTRHMSLLKNLVTARKFPPHASALYRTKIVSDLGGYRSRIHRAEDCDLWLRLSSVGELACISEPLVHIRKHSGQISLSEGGQRQVVDSRLAMVSYWLRHFNVVDPVDDDYANYNNFSTWIKVRLKELGLFEFLDHKERLKSYSFKSPFDCFRLICACMCKPFFTLRLIKERFIGESIARRLALEWIEKTKAG
jgi:glycosyltransferase involved in cell wall biosynthesis